jgi:type VI secretion system protein ImpK
MTPNFAAAVDPIFQFVLELQDRIERGEVSSPSHERERLRLRFQEAEQKLQQHEKEWQLAKYALVSWIDDVLIEETPWEGRNYWENNALEFEMFNTKERATQYYVKAKEAAALTRTDASEVCYVCAALGFRGFYRDSSDPEIPMLADHLDLPPDFESWAKKTAGAIRWGYGRPPIDQVRRSVGDNAPLEGKFMLLGTVVLGAVLAAVLIGLVLSLDVNLWQILRL